MCSFFSRSFYFKQIIDMLSRQQIHIQIVPSYIRSTMYTMVCSLFRSLTRQSIYEYVLYSARASQTTKHNRSAMQEGKRMVDREKYTRSVCRIYLESCNREHIVRHGERQKCVYYSHSKWLPAFSRLSHQKFITLFIHLFHVHFSVYFSLIFLQKKNFFFFGIL